MAVVTDMLVLLEEMCSLGQDAKPYSCCMKLAEYSKVMRTIRSKSTLQGPQKQLLGRLGKMAGAPSDLKHVLN